MHRPSGYQVQEDRARVNPLPRPEAIWTHDAPLQRRRQLWNQRTTISSENPFRPQTNRLPNAPTGDRPENPIRSAETPSIARHLPLSDGVARNLGNLHFPAGIREQAKGPKDMTTMSGHNVVSHRRKIITAMPSGRPVDKETPCRRPSAVGPTAIPIGPTPIL